jgi:nucleoside-diphosphate-sugar epimerase
VDVRDVALAHVLAAEGAPGDARTCGRFILMAGSIPWRVFCDVLRQTLPGAPVPTEVEPGPPSAPQALTSCKRTWELGLRYRPLEDSIRDCALSVQEKGFLG